MQTHRGNFSLRPGFCVWMRPGGIYDAQTHPKNTLGITYIHFDLYRRQGSRLKLLPMDTSAGCEFYDLMQLNYVDAITSQIVELVNHQASQQSLAVYAASDLLRGLLIQMQLWTKQMQSAQLPQQHVMQMQQIAGRMRESLSALPTVKKLAQQSGYSVTHFCELFKTVHGKSPQTYAIDLRMQRARELLAESDQNVSQIAEQLGYRDVFFFSRQFKSRIGQSPLQYRKHLLAGNLIPGDRD